MFSERSYAHLLDFWGKARPRSTAGPPCHPCLYHCLDVAAVGEALLDSDPELLRSISGSLGWPIRATRQLLLFLLALHDIGKISRPFQAMAPEHWPTSSLGPYRPCTPQPRHGAAGFALVMDLLPTHPAFAGWRPRVLRSLLMAILGHHGRPVVPPDGLIENETFGPGCRSAAAALVTVATSLFRPEPVPQPEAKSVRQATWRLAGFAVLADWLGSNERWFPYRLPTLSPDEYLEAVARPAARIACRQAGLAHARSAPPTGLTHLTGIERPSPVQTWAERVILPDGPCMLLIEDMTGSGKTEAALLLAHRLIAAGRARGVYLALPTMATANAMYARMAGVYRRMFSSAAEPSLALAHGRHRLHVGFRATLVDISPAISPAEAEKTADAKGDDAGAACAAWLADDRRRAFLADVGVGTIDQALLAVLPAKYQSLRLFGLKDRVLIVDEAHAYDAYMGQELQRLLEFQAGLGGSAIVLSATLPQAKRAELAAAFSRGLGAPSQELGQNGYPLVTVISRGGIDEEVRGHRPDLERELKVTRLAHAEEAVGRAVSAAAAGAAVAWIRNTVDDALEGAELIRQAGADPALFHARFAMSDRLEIEQEIVARFGKDGDERKRSGIIVATQVIEQSLDLDFDLLISDLAPVDLLLQRAGRLWRHRRGARPVAGPELLVVAPDPGDAVASDWYSSMFPGAAYVYQNHALLWLTADKLFGRPSWRVPAGVRELVEHVYGTAAAGSFPPALQQNAERVEGEEMAAVWVASENLLRFDKGYALQDQPWDEDKRVPTRLGDPSVVLRLARIERNDLVPWHDDPAPQRAWAFSEVSVRAGRAQREAIPADLRSAADRALRTWTRHDEAKLLVPLAEVAPGHYQGAVLDSRGVARTVRYDARDGLRFA